MLCVKELRREDIPFIHQIYEQNRAVLHGDAISQEEWHAYIFGEDADFNEAHFIIMDGDSPAAWLKLNALNEPDIWISMLVVDREFQRRGIGSFAIQFAETRAKDHAKRAVRVQTTKDNIIAKACYLNCGYEKMTGTRTYQKFQKIL